MATLLPAPKVRLPDGTIYALGSALCSLCEEPLPDLEAGELIWCVPGRGHFHGMCYDPEEDGMKKQKLEGRVRESADGLRSRRMREQESDARQAERSRADSQETPKVIRNNTGIDPAIGHTTSHGW